MTTFKKGDTVRLKSGGPVMTVSEFGESQFSGVKAWCTWFDDKHKQHENTFEPCALELVRVS